MMEKSRAMEIRTYIYKIYRYVPISRVRRIVFKNFRTCFFSVAIDGNGSKLAQFVGKQRHNYYSLYGLARPVLQCQFERKTTLYNTKYENGLILDHVLYQNESSVWSGSRAISKWFFDLDHVQLSTTYTHTTYNRHGRGPSFLLFFWWTRYIR